MDLSHQRRFHVRYCLGRGGFGEVYRATMESQGGLRSEVALKVLRVDLGPDGDAVRRLRDEGRLLAALDHPVILRAYDLAVLDGRVGLVTEFVNGEDLASVIHAPDPVGGRAAGGRAVGGRAPLPPRALVAVVGAVAEALHVAWTSPSPDTGEPMRLVHRDIKPSNIRIGTHGEVKLLDFGIARSEQIDREAHTNAGSAIGSLPYMAPERFGRVGAAPPADVYALGCTLFEGLARRRLFPDAVPVEMFRLAADHRAHFAHVQAALDTLELDADLAGLLAVMLSHEPVERPTAREVALVCEELAERLGGVTLKRWARDHGWPKAEAVPGHFEGRTLTEGTLDTSESLRGPGERASGAFVDSSATYALDLPADEVVTRPSAVPAPRRSPVVFVGAAVVLLGVGVGAWISWPGAELAEVAPPPVVRTEVRQVVAPPPVPEAVEAVPEPVEVVAEPVPELLPEPVPEVVPEPVAAPEVAQTPEEPVSVEPVATGTVALVTRGVVVELRGGGAVFAPGELPVGRYDLWADFGSGMLQRGRVDVVVGRRVTIRCNTLTYGCDVED